MKGCSFLCILSSLSFPQYIFMVMGIKENSPKISPIGVLALVIAQIEDSFMLEFILPFLGLFFIFLILF